ncbi:TetR/AcrR family transcriptional regulator [Rhodococcus sp. (in: high G+C Gram-positive bacteria)]|uniref:TetR/AcrR family transcriptional regulator n=1 Tax=Rhodococcus sp. TaxID=1831 RepID=UPI00388D08B2
MTKTRVLRADAARNRDLLLRAAEELFAERGLDVGVADIAAHAGVGKGTLFRHFASKDELIAAVVQLHIEALDEVGRGLLDAPDAGDALFRFLAIAAERQQERDLSFLLPASETFAEIAALRDRLFDTIGRLVARAQSEGAVRPDVSGRDVVLLMCAPNHIVGYLRSPPAGLWRRYLSIIIDGLRPQGAHPLPRG